MIERALARWTRAVMGGELGVLSQVTLAVNADAVAEWASGLRYYDSAPENEEEIDAPNMVLFVLTPWDLPRVYDMKDKCEAIERATPGLAKLAFRMLHDALHVSAEPFTPHCAHEIIESYFDMSEDEADEGAITAATFSAEFPAWLLNCYRGRPFPAAALARLARADPVAAAVRDLKVALADRRALTPSILGYHAGFSVVLRWSGDDSVMRIYDDWVNDVHSGGEGCEDFSQHPVKLDAREIERFLDRLARMLRILAGADRLLQLIAEEA